MKKLLSALLSIFAVSFILSAQGQSVQFDYSAGEPGNRHYISLPKGGQPVKAILYCHQNMTEEVLFRSAAFTERMDSLGVAMAFIQRGSQNWDVTQGCQERFEAIIADFAQGTGHPEIADAPIIPFGHSAQATFPWNFAAWNPDRTLCIISYHGDAPRTNLCGYGRANVEWGRTRNIDNIPGLMIEGEYEWWEARVRPALAFQMMYPDSKISFLCDAGKGHFDLCLDTQLYIAKFIEKALANPRPTDGVYYSRWSPDGTESDNHYDWFWYQDEEMRDWTRSRYEATRNTQPQYVSAIYNGQLIPYDPTKHIKMNLRVDTTEFTLTPVLVDSTRTHILPQPPTSAACPNATNSACANAATSACANAATSACASASTSACANAATTACANAANSACANATTSAYANATTSACANVAALPTVTLISGPAIQTGPTTFRFDPDYFGFDPERLWSGITVVIEAPAVPASTTTLAPTTSNSTPSLAPAVQELNIQLSLPRQ